MYFEEGNNMKKNIHGRFALTVAAFCTVATLSASNILVSFADSYGTVSAQTAKVRSETNTGSNVLGSLKKDDKVQILQETTDESGQVWYKVNVAGGTGYVRGDLVSKTDGVNTDANSAQVTVQTDGQNNQVTSETQPAAQQLPETQVTSMDPQNAVVTTKGANVRSGAGTAYSVAGHVVKNDSVTVYGSATGTDNKKWLYITLSNGAKGFIRADLVQIGAAPEANQNANANGDPNVNANGDPNASADPNAGQSDNAGQAESAQDAPQAESSQQPQEQAQQPTKRLATDSDTYYIYIDEQGKYELVDTTKDPMLQYEVSGVLSANDYVLTHGKKNSGSKLSLLTIILGILVVILGGAVIFLFFRLRSLLYYDDSEEYGQDQEDYSEEDIPEEEPKEKKRGRFAGLGHHAKQEVEEYPEDEEYVDDEEYQDDYSDEEIEEDRSNVRDARMSSRRDDRRRPFDEDDFDIPKESERSSKMSSRRARNFVDDDMDEDEFGFLDLGNGKSDRRGR